MPRPSKPYASHGGWRFTYRGKKRWRATQAGAWVLLNELQAGEPRIAAKRPHNVQALIDRWESLHGSREMLDEFGDWAGRRPLGDTGPDLLLEYHDHIRSRAQKRGFGHKNGGAGKLLSTETVRKKIRHAATVLRYAHDSGWVGQMPTMPKLSLTPPRPKALPPDELADLFESLRSPAHRAAAPLVRYMLETGCRPGEARLLRWSSVDTASRAVVLQRHKSSRTGHPRVIPLNDAAIEILASVRGRNADWVFVSRLGSPYTRTGLAAILGRLGVTQYQLRHTWCQRASDAGIAEEVICEIMGHQSSQMLKMYRSISSARVREAVSRLGSLSPPDIPAHSPPKSAGDSASKHRRSRQSPPAKNATPQADRQAS